MPIIEDSILIAARAEGLFALSQDYALRGEWDPFVREMRFGAGATEPAAGVHVWVRAWTGLTMEVLFVGFRPPSAVAMTMEQGPFFFEKFAGTWLFKPHPSGATKVTFRYSFTTRLRRLRPLLDRMIVRVLHLDIRARLRGLKWGAEDGGLLDPLDQTRRAGEGSSRGTSRSAGPVGHHVEPPHDPPRQDRRRDRVSGQDQQPVHPRGRQREPE
jgi:ribosome-associated toxin RatA of RatAB toxin-antitoxin module